MYNIHVHVLLVHNVVYAQCPIAVKCRTKLFYKNSLDFASLYLVIMRARPNTIV